MRLNESLDRHTLPVEGKTMKKLVTWYTVVLTLILLAVFLVAGYGCRVKTYTDTEETISTNVSQEFTIALHTSPRVGNHWEESHDGNMLALVEITYTPDDKSTPGVSGTRYFRFKALEVGRTEVTFTYKTVTDRVIEQKVFDVDIK